MREATNTGPCEKILVVDDAPANLHFLNNFLTEHGYAVYPASDGELALEFVRSILPDLILLDVRIPGMDGFEVCRRLKAEERTRDIPIIFISILEDEQDKVKGFKAGAVDYITKPFQPEEVLARIGTHLHLRNLAEHLERTVSERTEELLTVNSRLENELAERNRIEEKLRESENRFRLLFENSPVSIWEEDFSGVHTFFKKLEKEGIVDIEVYFDQHPETVHQCAQLVRIVDVNRAALTLHGAATKDALLEGLINTFTPESFETFRQELVTLWRGKTELECDAVVKDFTGGLRYVSMYFSVCPGYERTLSKIFVSLIDISSRKRAEEALSLNAERMEVLLHLNKMTDQTLEEITGYAFEAAVRLTRSQLGYLVFVNEDETLLTMQLWSQEAMSECEIHDKPIVFPVETTGLWGEAVRQRRPIITNDYSAPNPWKKGTPEGNVPLRRHLNLPVIVGGKIVLVAGVGNKVEEYNDADVKQLALLMEGMWFIIERKKAQEKLLKNNEELEQRVRDRTVELEANNKELERINRIFVGRELRMTELKKKIQEMESRNGPPDK